MERSKVAIVKGKKNPPENEINSMVRHAIELIGGLSSLVAPNDRVLIKPNLVVPRKTSTGVTTDPIICKILADMVRDIGASPIIAESSAFGEDTEEAFEIAGYNQLRELGYTVLDLKKPGIKKVKVIIPRGKVLKEIELPKIVIDANLIISVPKMKTHDQSSVTLSLKNMFGIQSDLDKRKLHSTLGVFQGVADLCTIIKPGLAVVDGIIGLEGLGPIFGTPIERDLIIAGTDPVAVDAITSMAMGFTPAEIELTQIAKEQGIGIMNLDEIEVLGASITDVQYRFKRGNEAVQEQIIIPEGFNLDYQEPECTGCKNTVYSVLYDMDAEDLLEHARDTHIMVSPQQVRPQFQGDRIYFVGNCTSEYKAFGTYVPGCPPNNRDIRTAIIQE